MSDHHLIGSVPNLGVPAQKEALRDGMRRLRTAMAPRDRDRLRGAIEERVLAIGELGAAQTVLLFYSFGSEVETGGLARRLLSGGKRLLLPFLDPERMEAAEVLPGEPLVPTRYGPREPSRRVPVEPDEVSLVIAPGLAFDRRGYRLGYGGGHYDRYLSRLPPRTLRVGIGFSFQLLDRVPSEETDERLHRVITDAEIVDCRPL